jgi:hypothetical protein
MVVAVAPYAVLSNTVLNLRSQYAGWLPQSLIKAGLRQLPSVLGTTADQLDTTTQLTQHPVKALLVAADGDDIAPECDVAELQALAEPGSKMIVVHNSTHETVTYHFEDLAGPISEWLSAGGKRRGEALKKAFDTN